MLDLDSNEEEVDFANDNVLQMVSAQNQRLETLSERNCSILRFIVLEFDVKAVFNADLHLDRIIAVWRHTEGVHPYVSLFVDICHTT